MARDGAALQEEEVMAAEKEVFGSGDAPVVFGPFAARPIVQEFAGLTIEAGRPGAAGG